MYAQFFMVVVLRIQLRNAWYYQCMSHYIYMAWYQWSHYMAYIVATNSCHTIALCQYVTLWHEANACHRYKIRHM